jgi:hypothetical protein
VRRVGIQDKDDIINGSGIAREEMKYCWQRVWRESYLKPKVEHSISETRRGSQEVAEASFTRAGGR